MSPGRLDIGALRLYVETATCCTGARPMMEEWKQKIYWIADNYEFSEDTRQFLKKGLAISLGEPQKATVRWLQKETGYRMKEDEICYTFR